MWRLQIDLDEFKNLMLDNPEDLIDFYDHRVMVHQGETPTGSSI